MALNEINQGGGPGDAERDPGLDRLYRATGREEPPAHLDAAILAAARREVGARPRPLSSTVHRWRVPVSIAAVVVLSVSLVALVREEGGDQLMQVPPPASVEPPDARPAPAAPTASEMKQSRPPAAVPAPPRRAPREDARDAPVALGKMTDGFASGAAGPTASQGAGEVSAPDAAVRSQPRAFQDVPSPAERRAAAAEASPSTEDSTARAPAVAERRAAPPASAPATEAAGARSTMQARKEAAPGDDRLPVWHGYEKEPPQKWLDRIAELKRERRAVEAEAMLAEFKRRFPSHPLPTELK